MDVTDDMCIILTSLAHPHPHPTCSTPTPAISIDDNNISSASTVIDSIHISKFHFTHVIKVLQGTNLLQSDNESTTIYSNSIGDLTHLITPIGYHIRSS
jgi:hypothetical protein